MSSSSIKRKQGLIEHASSDDSLNSLFIYYSLNFIVKTVEGFRKIRFEIYHNFVQCKMNKFNSKIRI